MSSKIMYAFSNHAGKLHLMSIAGPMRRTTVEMKMDSRSNGRKVSGKEAVGLEVDPGIERNRGPYQGGLLSEGYGGC